jgi:hypothetical protein
VLLLAVSAGSVHVLCCCRAWRTLGLWALHAAYPAARQLLLWPPALALQQAPLVPLVEPAAQCNVCACSAQAAAVR